ncbi:MAG: molybdenum cofactor biosynthesis protein MoaE [Alphaproteobacteria bacterium]|jgi:molybdopterin synthase catalytic subunit|nr:molybdenum cofactor biosynthesis protein MoaE [Alphaproteobacteria bacterium]
MTQSIYTGISEETLSIQKAADFVDAAENGALNMFIGKVRNHNMGKAVNAVSYDVFAPLACNVFQEICAEATAQFGERLRLYIEHYKGKLEIGGISVIIAVGSPHRDESFQACRYLIEQLKIRAPIWKQEHYVDGVSEWVKGHTLCGHHHG